MKLCKDKERIVVPSIWETIEPRQHTLHQATTRKGNPCWLWKPIPISQETQRRQLYKGLDTRYSCHGFTIGSHQLPGGPYSPYGDGIDIVLQDEFHNISVEDLTVNDVIVWRDEDGDISHTARITEIYKDEHHQLLDKTRLATKNGAGVQHQTMRLSTLKSYYGQCMTYHRDGSREPLEIEKKINRSQGCHVTETSKKIF